MIKLSVIICTYNRAYILPECLNALTRQTVALSEVELIIIDNNSTDDTKTVVESFNTKFSNFKYVLEKNIGLSHARNRGYKEASSEWILYLDDDGKVHFNCIEEVLWTIDNCKFDCFGGAFYPWYKYGKPKWYKDEWGTNTWDKPDKTSVLKNGYICGGIMTINKEILMKLDGFNTKIGMQGSVIGYGEETLFLKNIRNNGYVIGYNPNIKMDHLVAKYKLSPFWFIKSSFARGRDSWLTFDLDITDASCSIWKYLWRNKNITKLFLIFLFKMFSRNYYWQNFIIDVFKNISTDCGRYFGAKKYYKFKQMGNK